MITQCTIANTGFLPFRFGGQGWQSVLLYAPHIFIFRDDLSETHFTHNECKLVYPALLETQFKGGKEGHFLQVLFTLQVGWNHVIQGSPLIRGT
jgi:hypothetical protein